MHLSISLSPWHSCIYNLEYSSIQDAQAHFAHMHASATNYVGLPLERYALRRNYRREGESTRCERNGLEF